MGALDRRYEGEATGENFAPDEAFLKRREGRNKAIALALTAFIVLLFVTTIVKLSVSVGSL